MVKQIVSKVKPVDIEEEMKKSYLDYSMSVIVGRALPDVRDGLKPVHRRILYAMYDMGITNDKPHKKSARITGECFVKDTLVLTDRGLIQIKNIKCGDKIYTQNGLGTVTKLYEMPEKKLLKVTLENGLSNIVTPSQKFKVLTPEWKFEWKDAKDLNYDFITIRATYPKIKENVKLKTAQSHQTKHLNENIGYLLGLFLSDGSISNDYGSKKLPRLSFYGSKEVIENVTSIFKQEFDYTPTIELKKGVSNNLYFIRINRKNINEFFVSNFSLEGVNALKKKISEQIFNSPENVIFAFISGLIEGDGSIHKNRCTIHYGSISEKMIDQLMIILQHYGIFSSKYINKNIKSHYVCGRKVIARHPFYYLEIQGKNAVNLAKKLKLINRKKQERVHRIAAIKRKDIGFRYDIVPYAGEKIFKELSKYHRGGGWYKDINENKFIRGIKYNGGCKIRYSKNLHEKPLRKSQIIKLGIKAKLKRIGSDLNNFVEEIIHDDIYFMKVSSIEEVEPQKTYDIEVEKEHEFIANSMISHNCLGKYHPHGDTSVYDALVRMAQDFSLRYLLIDGHGNFGSVDGDNPAAMRYTEARLSSLSMEMIRDINKDTVEFVDNFDSSLKEPEVLPCKFPNLLVNGSSGIAVGMATNMPPHNLKEAVDGIIAYIDDPKISLKNLMKKIKGPDFPTGGLILGMGGIKEAYETGKGKITVRAKTHLETMKSKKKRIVITELPYQVNKANLIRKIAELVREKKIEGIYDLRDESDRTGMRVVIELKKDSQPYVILNNLYKHTQLQDTFGIINIALVDGVPKLITIHELIDNYIKHQFNVVTRLTKYELKKAKNRAHILDGILIALANLDKVIKLIKTSKTVSQARQRLIKNFKLTTIQAQAILDMKLQRLTGLERDKVQKEQKQLLEKIEYCEKVLSDEKLVYQIIKKDLRDIVERFGDERRTIIAPTEEEIDIEDLIAEEDMIVTITHSGYIKRIPITTYRKQRRGGIGVMGMNLKEDDFVEHLFISSTHQFMLFFTNRGKVYKIKAYGLPTGGRTSKGKSIRNFFNFSYNERIEMVITTDNFKFKEFIIMVTKNGLIKKTELSQYKNASRGGLIAINLKKKDEIVGVSRIKPKEEIILISANGKGIRFGENQIRSTSRNTMGVRAMRLNKGDRILGMGIAVDDTDLLLITKNGYGKRTAISEYKVQRRGGKGVIAIKTDSKTGKLIGCKVVRKNNELVLISNDGTLIRVSVDSIRKVGRQARGVKVMKLREGDKVSSLAKVAGG